MKKYRRQTHKIFMIINILTNIFCLLGFITFLCHKCYLEACVVLILLLIMGSSFGIIVTMEFNSTLIITEDKIILNFKCHLKSPVESTTIKKATLFFKDISNVSVYKRENHDYYVKFSQILGITLENGNLYEILLDYYNATQIEEITTLLTNRVQ